MSLFIDFLRRFAIVACLTYPYWVTLLLLIVFPFLSFAWIIDNVSQLTEDHLHPSLIIMEIMTILMYYCLVAALFFIPALRDTITRPVFSVLDSLLYWAISHKAEVLDAHAILKDSSMVWDDVLVCLHPAIDLELKTAMIAEVLLRRHFNLVRSKYLFKQGGLAVKLLTLTNPRFYVEDRPLHFNDYRSEVLLLPAPLCTVNSEGGVNTDCAQFIDSTRIALLNSSSSPVRQVRLLPVYIEGEMPEVGYFWAFLMGVLFYGLPRYYVSVGQPVLLRNIYSLDQKYKEQSLNEYFCHLQYAKAHIDVSRA